MAKADRLNAFRDVHTIDNIVRRSMGAYSHDDVWFLSLTFVMTLSLFYYEQDCYQIREHNIKEQLKPKK